MTSINGESRLVRTKGVEMMMFAMMMGKSTMLELLLSKTIILSIKNNRSEHDFTSNLLQLQKRDQFCCTDRGPRGLVANTINWQCTIFHISL
jgi:hypothetical protein